MTGMNPGCFPNTKEIQRFELQQGTEPFKVVLTFLYDKAATMGFLNCLHCTNQWILWFAVWRLSCMNIIIHMTGKQITKTTVLNITIDTK